jgi:hypothetical protein
MSVSSDDGASMDSDDEIPAGDEIKFFFSVPVAACLSSYKNDDRRIKGVDLHHRRDY